MKFDLQQLIKEDLKISIRIPMTMVNQQDPSKVSSISYRLNDIIFSLTNQIDVANAELQVLREIKEEFLWSIKHSEQLGIRDVKREFLLQYFPEEIKNLYYYQGGDKFASDKKEVTNAK